MQSDVRSRKLKNIKKKKKNDSDKNCRFRREKTKKSYDPKLNLDYFRSYEFFFIIEKFAICSIDIIFNETHARKKDTPLFRILRLLNFATKKT